MELLKSIAIKYAVRGLYHLVSSVNANSDLTVLNYGYYDGNDIPYDPEDMPNLLRLSLYHHVAEAVNLSNMDVLEVGSGRGGGASYMARHLGPKSIRGVDISGKAVQFCQKRHQIPGLTFSIGDAERLEFEDDSFDVVINIESSHNYPNIGRFIDEAYRVLRPGGFFLLADMRFIKNIPELQEMLEKSGFMMISKEYITQNVLSALDRDNSFKDDFIASNIPRLLRRPFSIFAGTRGTHFYNQLQLGNMEYVNFVLQK